MRWLPVLFLCASVVVSAQPYSSSGKRYKDKFSFELMPGEAVVRSWFHYVVSSTNDGRWVVRTFYPETGQQTSMVTYSDKLLTKKSGPAKYWYDDGRISAQGDHLEDQRFGPWTELRGKGSYSKGIEDGPWVLHISETAKDSGRFSKGQRTGDWLRTDSLGRPFLIRHYKAGKLDGDWVMHDLRNGTTKHRVYRADSLIEGVMDDPTVNERMPFLRECEHLNTEAERKACTESMIHAYLSEPLSYPKAPRKLGVSGPALINFTVENDGTISRITALNGLCHDIEEECIRVLKNMPLWVPGEQFGKTVPVQYQQPMKFTLK